MIRGQSLYQLGRYREAITPLKKAIEDIQKQKVTPDENWLLLLRACYHEEEDFRAMLNILKILVVEYPKVDYIKNIASVFFFSLINIYDFHFEGFFSFRAVYSGVAHRPTI